MSRHMRKPISRGERAWRVLVTVFGVIFLWCIITYLVTPLFMKYPNRDREAEAALGAMDTVRDITIQGNNSLSGYLLDDPSSDRLIIYFYGSSDNAAGSMLYFLDNPDTYAGLDIAVIDWPSYGMSKGWCSDSSMRTAACDIVNSFADGNVSGYSCGEIVIMAYSLGTGPAVYAAAECGCSDLVLISPYCSSADLYNRVTPVFYGPLKGLLGFEMETGEYAQSVSLKPLIIASEGDSRVPIASSERLADCFPTGCDISILTSVDHGSLPSDKETLSLIKQRLIP